ncbi:MAG: hypothetical protein JO270_16785 [Acidobacteriaceae bacterium]|nr:hypothetical protein [Acidobacteriaceae bacterium]
MSDHKRYVPAQDSSAVLCAMQVKRDMDGNWKMGLLTQLTAASPIEVCGEGFNEKTVKVRVKDSYYFVFRADLQSRYAPS